MEKDTYFSLKKHINKLQIIDTHEHLPPEKERLNEEVDVLATFFQYYASSDLKSAGMPENEIQKIWDTSISLTDRWETFEPWWEKIKNTSYSRTLETAAKGIYGVEGISKDTYKPLSKKIKEKNNTWKRL